MFLCGVLCKAFMWCFTLSLHQAEINLKSYFYQVFIHLFPLGFAISVSCLSQTMTNGVAENKDTWEDVTWWEFKDITLDLGIRVKMSRKKALNHQSHEDVSVANKSGANKFCCPKRCPILRNIQVGGSSEQTGLVEAVPDNFSWTRWPLKVPLNPEHFRGLF